MECGYLGPKGSYSYLALTDGYPELVPVACSTFTEIIEKIEDHSLPYGFLPVENSTEGAVTAVMDSLLDLNDIVIQGEVTYRIRHHLFSIDGKMEKIHCAISHPQALEQCRGFFRKNFPDIIMQSCESTSAACIEAKKKGCGYGAIASQWAGEYHGLKAAQHDIQDNRFNQTRFVKLGKGDQAPTGKDKTAMAFSFQKDLPGSLHQILKIFADQNINLSRIESRPAKQELGQYIFFIDFHGHCQDKAVKTALREIRKKTRKLYIFGSFPRADKPV